MAPPPPTPPPTIKRGIGEFSPTAAFQLEKNLQHARYLVAAGMPLLLGFKGNTSYNHLIKSFSEHIKRLPEISQIL